MTRSEYNKLPSNGRVACPDCGSHSTHPHGGCGCPYEEVKPGIGFTKHINEWHHTCNPAEKKLNMKNDWENEGGRV